MNISSQHNADERLIAPLLQLLDGDSPEGLHPDEEVLVLFVENGLIPDERMRVIEHLDQCPECRATTALLLRHDDGSITTIARAPRITIVRAVISRRYWLVAATLLLAVGLFVAIPRGPDNRLQLAEQSAYNDSQRLLAAGDYAAAQTRIEQAAAADVHSSRLTVLLSQAIRQMPAVVALANMGQLTDFGYDVGGIQSRAALSEAERQQLFQALEILSTADSQDRDVRLNRGHLLLSLNRDAEAVVEFQSVLDINPDDPLAWLGLGLAEFVQNDFNEAATAFERSRELAPESVPAQLNLALTLEEQGKSDEALDVWRKLATQPLRTEDRQRVNEAIRLLDPPAAERQ